MFYINWRSTFEITQTWDSQPTGHGPIRVTLTPTQNGLVLDVGARFFNDPPNPGGDAGKPFPQLWDYEGIEVLSLTHLTPEQLSCWVVVGVVMWVGGDVGILVSLCPSLCLCVCTSVYMSVSLSVPQWICWRGDLIQSHKVSTANMHVSQSGVTITRSSITWYYIQHHINRSRTEFTITKNNPYLALIGKL